MCCVAGHEPDGRRTLPVQADITGSTLRLILRLDSLHLRAQRAGARANAFSLLPLVLAFLLSGHSENRSRKLPNNRKKDGFVRGVEQHREDRVRQRKGAGRTLETAGSTCDLINLSKVAHPGREIYASGSLREPDHQ